VDGRPEEMFHLGEGYKMGIEIAQTIRDGGILGRIAGLRHDMGVLSEAVFRAGDGDHVEIGTLYGASAIQVALVKKHFNLGGDVYCIDPFDGYYGPGRMDGSGVPVVAETFLKNCTTFGVLDRVVPVAKKSIPWPLGDKKFVSAYVDGDHDGKAPWKDIEICRYAGARYIVVDNYDTLHSAVRDACMTAAWGEYQIADAVHISGITCVLETLNEHK